MKKISVKLDNRSYPILIDKGLFGRLLPLAKKMISSGRLVGLTTRNIARLYSQKLPKIPWIVIPDGERIKNLRTVEKIYRRLAALKVDRQTGLVVLGGGVVGDIGGFVAATYLRGIPFIQVPTTLLAQVDSSVGGKTGVDLKEGKNLVGAFYQPRAVLIDTNFLKTLPKREFLCGLAEVVKYGIIRDEKFFKFIEKNQGRILSLESRSLSFIIGRSCEIKAGIVSRDEKETTGLRSLLNFGHTVGHAIETLSGYNRIRHGEAVSRGMVYAATLSCRKGLCSREVAERISRLLKRLGLPTRWPAWPPSAYARVVSLDKKGEGKKIRFITIKKIGRAEPVDLTVGESVRYLQG